MQVQTENSEDRGFAENSQEVGGDGRGLRYRPVGPESLPGIVSDLYDAHGEHPEAVAALASHTVVEMRRDLPDRRENQPQASSSLRGDDEISQLPRDLSWGADKGEFCENEVEDFVVYISVRPGHPEQCLLVAGLVYIEAHLDGQLAKGVELA